MRSPRITEENLANQLDVVKNEIRVNVLNRPYGGFPWIYLPAVLFDTFANCAQRLRRLRGPRERHRRRRRGLLRPLLRAGERGARRRRRPRRRRHPRPDREALRRDRQPPRPKRPSFAEPALTAERRDTHHDAHAPIPAVAIGYRVPDPVGSLEQHLAHVLLAEVLSDGDASRLQRRLVQQDHLVTDVAAYIGEFGDPFDERDPTALTISAHYPQAERAGRGAASRRRGAGPRRRRRPAAG